MIFAVAHLSKDLPHFWSIVVQFGTRKREGRSCITPDEARVIFEILEDLDKESFSNDPILLQDLIWFSPETSANCKQPQGRSLISSKTACLKCGSMLSLRAD